MELRWSARKVSIKEQRIMKRPTDAGEPDEQFYYGSESEPWCRVLKNGGNVMG